MISGIYNQLTQLIDDIYNISTPNEEEFLDSIKQARLEIPTHQCSKKEKENFELIKTIHDRIELIAYKALIEGIKKFHITSDTLTEEQSGQLLNHIKCAAHKEMFKKDGYIDSRGRLLNSSQVQKIIANVGKIIHDRDTKLTNARYHSLSELLLGMDDHNTMVKDILLSSWTKHPVSDNSHLHLKWIKSSIDFYPQAEALVGYDLERALEEKKEFWDTYFPGKRESLTDEDSIAFINILEVRNHFGMPSATGTTLEFTTPNGSVSINKNNFDTPLKDHLCSSCCLFTSITKLNAIGQRISQPSILDRDITVREFLQTYYPDLRFPDFCHLLRS